MKRNSLDEKLTRLLPETMNNLANVTYSRKIGVWIEKALKKTKLILTRKDV